MKKNTKAAAVTTVKNVQQSFPLATQQSVKKNSAKGSSTTVVVPLQGGK